jgi:prophage regulatory protein
MNALPNSSTFNNPSAQPIQQSQLTPVLSSRIIRIKQVIALTGLSRSTIYDRMDCKSPRYDMSFPKQVKLGISTQAAVGWRESEVLAWISQCH